VVITMTTYSNEDRARILEAARVALEAAQASLDAPRAEIEPHIESRSERWRREAAEQEQRFAQERREWSLTETEAQRLEHRLAGLVGEQKEFFLQLLAELTAELRHEFDQKVAELNTELGLLRADVTISKAFAKGEPGGDVIDLPNPLRRRA
jgi:hypothetical protein